jgi:hypothetical protein
MIRLVCDIQTTSFLGTHAVALDVLKILQLLPASFAPMKVRTSHSPAQSFSFDSPEHFIERLPGNMCYEGNVSLVKTRGVFEFFVQWQKGKNEWFSKHPTKPFNTAGFSSERWEEALSNNHFPIFQNIFVSLCESFRAVYGSIRLEDSTIIDPPNGFGCCLPRLHWITYLGKSYTKAMDNQLAKPCSSCTLSRLSEGMLIQLSCSALDAIKQSVVESLAIKHLGIDYFWNPKDNWRKPQFHYRMPELDWSSIITAS